MYQLTALEAICADVEAGSDVFMFSIASTLLVIQSDGKQSTYLKNGTLI